MNPNTFSAVPQLEVAIAQMRRYQAAYRAANGHGVVVRYSKDWYEVNGKLYRPARLMSLAANLEARAKAKIQEEGGYV